MIQICPERDAQCPHGSPCPYALDRYSCKPEGLPPRAIEGEEARLRQVEEDLRFACEGMRQALLKAQDLINAIDQTAFGVFQVGGDDPELLVCQAAEAIGAALSDPFGVAP